MQELEVTRRIQKACIWAGPVMGVLFVRAYQSNA